jgi:flavin-dependent dehydrogenase
MLVVPQHELHRHRLDIDSFAEDRARALAGELFGNAQLAGKRIGIGPLSYRARRLAGRRVLLAGDAACFVDPFTGQGVYLALRCGEIAAQCILSGSLQTYESLARREIARRERAAARVRRIITSRVFARAGAMLMRSAPWVMRPLVNAVAGAA